MARKARGALLERGGPARATADAGELNATLCPAAAAATRSTPVAMNARELFVDARAPARVRCAGLCAGNAAAVRADPNAHIDREETLGISMPGNAHGGRAG